MIDTENRDHDPNIDELSRFVSNGLFDELCEDALKVIRIRKESK